MIETVIRVDRWINTQKKSSIAFEVEIMYEKLVKVDKRLANTRVSYVFCS